MLRRTFQFGSWKRSRKGARCPDIQETLISLNKKDAPDSAVVEQRTIASDEASPTTSATSINQEIPLAMLSPRSTTKLTHPTRLMHRDRGIAEVQDKSTSEANPDCCAPNVPIVEASVELNKEGDSCCVVFSSSSDQPQPKVVQCQLTESEIASGVLLRPRALLTLFQTVPPGQPLRVTVDDVDLVQTLQRMWELKDETAMREGIKAKSDQLQVLVEALWAREAPIQFCLPPKPLGGQRRGRNNSADAEQLFQRLLKTGKWRKELRWFLKTSTQPTSEKLWTYSVDQFLRAQSMSDCVMEEVGTREEISAAIFFQLVPSFQTLQTLINAAAMVRAQAPHSERFFVARPSARYANAGFYRTCMLESDIGASLMDSISKICGTLFALKFKFYREVVDVCDRRSFAALNPTSIVEELPTVVVNLDSALRRSNCNVPVMDDQLRDILTSAWDYKEPWRLMREQEDRSWRILLAALCRAGNKQVRAHFVRPHLIISAPSLPSVDAPYLFHWIVETGDWQREVEKFLRMSKEFHAMPLEEFLAKNQVAKAQLALENTHWIDYKKVARRLTPYQTLQTIIAAALIVRRNGKPGGSDRILHLRSTVTDASVSPHWAAVHQSDIGAPLMSTAPALFAHLAMLGFVFYAPASFPLLHRGSTNHEVVRESSGANSIVAVCDGSYMGRKKTASVGVFFRVPPSFKGEAPHNISRVARVSGSYVAEKASIWAALVTAPRDYPLHVINDNRGAVQWFVNVRDRNCINDAASPMFQRAKSAIEARTAPTSFEWQHREFTVEAHDLAALRKKKRKTKSKQQGNASPSLIIENTKTPEALTRPSFRKSLQTVAQSYAIQHIQSKAAVIEE